MDRVIKNFNVETVKDGFAYCPKYGVAYQLDMTKSIDYNEDYFNDYVQRSTNKVAAFLNKERYNIVVNHGCLFILDIGIGSGAFLKYCEDHNILTAYGFDINKKAISWLDKRGIFFNPYTNKSGMRLFNGMTFWDSLEHIPNPHYLIDNIFPSTYVFISMPIYKNIMRIKESKHFKPNEHYYYFTADGIINWLGSYGFKLIEESDFEIKAGREGIFTFVFKRIYCQKIMGPRKDTC